SLLADRQERKEYWTNLLEGLKRLNLHAYLYKNLPSHEAVYSFFAVYILGATYALFFTIPEPLVIQYQKLYAIASHSVLVCTAAFLTYPAWPAIFKDKRFMTYAWP